MKKYILAFAAVAAMLASCSQDDNLVTVENGTENDTPQPITTIHASSEYGTRAAVNGDGTQILWQDGDKIGVINSSIAAPFTLTNGAGTTTGEFYNAQSGITSIDAVMYPYQENASYTNSKLSFEIPTVQKGVLGSFDKSAAIMYSLGSSASKQLSPAVNFLKISIPVGVRSVTISSPTTSLTGKMELEDGNVSEVIGEGCNYVRLIPANGQTRFIAGDYYIAVKPGEIVTPTIRFVQEVFLFGGSVLQENSKTSTNNIQLSVNKNVVPLKVDFNTGDVTQRLAIQLWSNGPYFAQYNVGVTDGREVSLGGYYAWGGCQDRVTDHWTGEGMFPGDHDTATKLWGLNWRMPTQAELQALLDNCDAELQWDPVKGFIGYKFTGKGDYTSKSVFLPAAGLCEDGGVWNTYVVGHYWSSTPAVTEYNYNHFNAYYMGFDKDGLIMSNTRRRYGHSVRAVIAE